MARTDYQRSFIIMHPLESGNPVKSGFCKMEAKNGRGRLTFTVQGFEPQEPGLKALLVRRLSTGAHVVDCGWVMVDGRGIGTMTYDFDPAAIDGAPYDKYNAVCICQSAEDIGFPLTGVVGSGGAVDWHGAVKASIASLMGRGNAEAAQVDAARNDAALSANEDATSTKEVPADAGLMEEAPLERAPHNIEPSPQPADVLPEAIQPEIRAAAAEAKPSLYVIAKPDAAPADSSDMLPEFRVHSGVIDTAAMDAAAHDAGASESVEAGAWEAGADACEGSPAEAQIDGMSGSLLAEIDADPPVVDISGAHEAQAPARNESMAAPAADAPSGDMTDPEVAPEDAAACPEPGEFIAGDPVAEEPAAVAFRHEPLPAEAKEDPAPEGYEPLMDEIATLDAVTPDHLIDELDPPARNADPITPSMLSTLTFPIPSVQDDWPGFAGQLRTLFDQFSRVEPFEVENFEFVRIPVSRGLQIDHYLVGLELEDGEPSTVCYCIPGSAAELPPAGLEGYQFRETVSSAGYWVTWADAATGETVPPRW